MHWKRMPEGKEKYSAYLCSRDWAVLKEAVADRSGGICERCTVNPMDHVHHLTYARKYAERLEDLQACCKQCHEFIHAKSDSDPAAHRPFVLPWCKTPVKTFYLAGKITGTTWRDAIVPGWSEENHSSSYWQAFYDYDETSTWCVVPNVCMCGGVGLHYSGPWWRDMFGHGLSSNSAGPHGYSSIDECPDVSDEFIQEIRLRETKVLRAVCEAIENADMLFAWIDSPDCYGTIYEIGFAKALGKVVVVATDEAFLETAPSYQMWLCRSGNYCVTEKTPHDAWRFFWDLAVFGKDIPSNG